MPLFALLFGLLSGCALSVLVGLIGSRHRIGFTLSFLLSLLFTPIAGLIFVLLSDPLPSHERGGLGCIGTLLGLLGLLFFVLFVMAFLGIGLFIAA